MWKQLILFGALFVCFGISCVPETRCQSDGDCKTGQTCKEGACLSGCKDSSECSDGQVCSEGLCRPCTEDSSCTKGFTCTSGRCECAAPKQICGGACVDPQSDLNHCGTCSNACQKGQVCQSGACAFCPATAPTQCGSVCANLQSDPKHCGKCDNAAKPGQICVGGRLRCPPGFVLCGDRCVHLKSSHGHCGGCNNACGPQQRCALGQCIDYDCSKTVLLTSLCKDVCTDTRRDALHCGACDKACRSDQLCDQGSCGCLPGLRECAGACVDVRTNWSHCGACGKACKQGQRCHLGHCKDSCPKDTADACFGGCFQLRSSRQHCGKCGNRCVGLKSCQKGACVCPPGWIECQGTCVDPQTDWNHCGGCGQKCPEGRKCGLGKCVETCPSVTPNACFHGCYDLQSNERHCGACGNACSLGQVCEKGQCSCPPGKTACDGVCVDLQRSFSHCGSCGKACGDGEFCASGTCEVSCPPATPTVCFGGCFDLKKSNDHCGECGTACTPGQLCIDGKCTDKSCETTGKGFQLCGGTCVNTEANAQHCGECSKACESGQSCKAGVCECPSGQKLCDASGGAKACVDPQTSKDHCGDCGTACAKDQKCVAGKCLRCTEDGECPAQHYCEKGVCRPDRCKNPPADEKCDGIDTNCNGKIDEGCVTTFAGTGTKAKFNGPNGMAFDTAGNLYIADTGNHAIRKLDVMGNVTTIAGAGSSGDKDEVGKKALFNGPRDVVIDKVGNLYVADTGNHKIKKIDSTGKVTTFAGSTQGNKDGAGGQAQFDFPTGLAIDPSTGTLYVAERGNHLIRKIDSAGKVTTLAGTGISGFTDDTGTKASFFEPISVAFDALTGNLYVADSRNHAIRKIDSSGKVTTVAGGTKGFKDDFGTNAQFDLPTGLVIDQKGVLFVADNENHRIRKIARDGAVTTLAGSGEDKSRGGLSTQASFSNPRRLTRHPSSGALLATEYFEIRSIAASGLVTTIAGDNSGFVDGKAQVEFNAPAGLVKDGSGNLILADGENHRILKIAPNGAISVLAGSGVPGLKDDLGVRAQFDIPFRLLFDSQGNLLVLDFGNHCIRKISPSGQVTTYAGTGVAGYKEGDRGQAQFHEPWDLAIDKNDNIYVADARNHRIRKISTTGVVSTVVGTGIAGTLDGPVAKAQLQAPLALVFDTSGNLFISDSGGTSIRKLDSTGVVSTFVGSGKLGFKDGKGTAAEFNGVFRMTLDHKGNLLALDSLNHAVREITPQGQVTTIAGTGIEGYLDGPAIQAQFANPFDFYFDGTSLFISDTGNHKIRKMVLP